MRFSAVFDASLAMRAAPAQDRAPAAPLLPPCVPASAAAVDSLPEELDQRVRMVGEWQLEDW
jgi:hypothetical protein